MELTKEQLKEKLLANDGELALELAKSGDKDFADSEFAQDIDIFSQAKKRVVFWLSWHSDVTHWTPKYKAILDLRDEWIDRYTRFADAIERLDKKFESMDLESNSE